VLTEEVLQALQVAPGKRYIDGTLGGAGHTSRILELGGEVLGIDTDPEAIEEAKSRLKERSGWQVVQGNFRDIERIAKEVGWNQVDGILFDLGVSSHQLDTPNRGFSYRFTDAPLDLRLRQTEGESAAQLVNRLNTEELYEIFTTFGEEERARAISVALVRARTVRPIESTADVLTAIESAGVPKLEVSSVASRIFQSLRIAINDELRVIEEGIRGAKNLLAPGGRLAIISFHSLEDRIVKLKLKEEGWKSITKKPMIATEEEQERNRRSRSAKLRIAEKL
jgi:16S rRNA (cytosine1402-N4)-methyltransferase